MEKHLSSPAMIPPRYAARCSIDDVLEILSTPLLGIIPESEEVLRASNVGSPVTLSNPASAPACVSRRRTGSLGGNPMAIHSERRVCSVNYSESGMSLLNWRRRGWLRRTRAAADPAIVRAQDAASPICSASYAARYLPR